MTVFEDRRIAAEFVLDLVDGFAVQRGAGGRGSAPDRVGTRAPVVPHAHRCGETGLRPTSEPQLGK